MTVTTSYANTGGTGNRSGVVTVTTTATAGGGAVSAVIDGVTASGSYWWNNAQTKRTITFDFGTAQVFDEVKWYQSSASSQGLWVVIGSNDLTNWNLLTATAVTLGSAATQTITLTGNPEAYRYLRLAQVNGTTNSTPFIREAEFKLVGTGGTVGTDDATTPDYGNPGGMFDRTGVVTVTSANTPSVGTGAALVNGSRASGEFLFTNGSSGHALTFDFGSGASKRITEVTIFHESASANHGSWKWQGSNDGSTFSDLGSTFTLGGALTQTDTTLSANTAGYRYYRLTQTSGTTNNFYLQEFDFKIADIAGVAGTATGALDAITGTAAGTFKKKTGGNGGGSTPGNIGAGDKYGTKVTMPETGTITTLILESQQTKTVNSRMALYADNSGVPGERIAVTADKSSVVTGENEYTLPTPIVRNSGSVFWIALHADATINWLLGTQTGGSYTNADTFSDGISNPFGTGTLLGTKAPLIAVYYEGVPIEVIVNGDGTGALSAITGTASGSHIPAIGTGAGTLSAITGAASGSHIPAIGSGTGALDAPTGAASGTHTATGTGAGALPALSGLGVSGAIAVGIGAGTLSALSGAGVGTGTTQTARRSPLRFLSSGDPRKQPDALQSISWLEQQAEQQKRLRDLFGINQDKPELVTGSGVAILAELTGQGTGALGRKGQAAMMLSPFGGSASADHWDSVSSDNELLLLAS